MKHIKLVALFVVVTFCTMCSDSKIQAQTDPIGPPRQNAERKVQVALLLDTSNSMDGLIEQAKSRLWNIVNTISTLKYNGGDVGVEIALYEYGNYSLSREENYIRKVTPLTTDLDLISEMLFALKTNGGLEYCGAVIKSSIDQLEWSSDSRDLKLIYIAGNEIFNQGPVNYETVCKEAAKKEIFINTIYCGNYETGIKELWGNGANLGNGKYFNIDANRAVRFIATPYDDEISKCNVKLNNTYIGYGSKGEAKKSAQTTQDSNAEHLSKANMVERAVTKSSKAYKNADWDIVDAVSEDKMDITKLKEEELPAELKGKTAAEKEAFVAQKSEERTKIQKTLSELAVKRQSYIDAENKKLGEVDDLGNSMSKSIKEIGLTKGFK